MGILHLAPGYSAAVDLRKAIEHAGLGQEVMALGDDLSCGPIRDYGAVARVTWWAKVYDTEPEPDPELAASWDRLARASDRLVAWVGRRSAMESSFLHALAHMLGDRPFSLIDVTGLPEAVHGVMSILPSRTLGPLIGTERAVTRNEHAALREHWRRLKEENAPFRVAMGTELVSVPENYFDAALMAGVTSELQGAAQIIGDATGHERAFMQVGDGMLHARLVALIEAGKLVADGDPWDRFTCRVRLPG